MRKNFARTTKIGGNNTKGNSHTSWEFPLFFPHSTQIVTKNTYKKNSQYLLKIAFINEKNSLGISDDSIIAKQKAKW